MWFPICPFAFLWGRKEWGSGEEGGSELAIWCGKPRSWLTRSLQLRCCLHTGINVCALCCLLGLCCGVCSDIQLRESCWAPECPPRSSGLRRPADGIVCHRCPPPPQRACPTVGAPSTRCRGGRGAVSRWTTRGSQGVSLQFLPCLPSFLPHLALGLPPHLPSRLFFSFVSFPFLPFSFLPFPSLPFSSLCVELKILL